MRDVKSNVTIIIRNVMLDVGSSLCLKDEQDFYYSSQKKRFHNLVPVAFFFLSQISAYIWNFIGVISYNFVY